MQCLTYRKCKLKKTKSQADTHYIVNLKAKKFQNCYYSTETNKTSYTLYKIANT